MPCATELLPRLGAAESLPSAAGLLSPVDICFAAPSRWPREISIQFTPSLQPLNSRNQFLSSAVCAHWSFKSFVFTCQTRQCVSAPTLAIAAAHLHLYAAPGSVARLLAVPSNLSCLHHSYWLCVLQKDGRTDWGYQDRSHEVQAPQHAVPAAGHRMAAKLVVRHSLQLFAPPGPPTAHSNRSHSCRRPPAFHTTASPLPLCLTHTRDGAQRPPKAGAAHHDRCPAGQRHCAVLEPPQPQGAVSAAMGTIRNICTVSSCTHANSS